MGPEIIARNYAETLLSLANRHGGEATVDEYGVAIDEVAALLESEPLVREFLETPRVDLAAKERALNASFAGRVPDLFLRFLIVVVQKRRQGVLRQIAEQYHALVDKSRGRVRAEIILAREADAGLQKEIVSSLERRLGLNVVPIFRTDPSIVGGVIIRVGGQILDGSLKRRTAGLRQCLLRARIPAASAASAAGEIR